MIPGGPLGETCPAMSLCALKTSALLIVACQSWLVPGVVPMR